MNFVDGEATQDAIFKAPLSAAAADAVLALGAAEGVVAQYYIGDDIHVHCKSDAHRELTERYKTLTGVPTAHGEASEAHSAAA